ncbi:MAG: clostripain-related cysteine peptidase [Oscillospiraceae bacterium]
MDRNNRPHSREKDVSGSSNGVHRRGSGLGTGRVGSHDYSSQGASHGSTAKRAAIGGGGGLTIIVLLVIFFFSKCSGPVDLSGNGGNGGNIGSNNSYVNEYVGGGSVNYNVADGSRDKRTSIMGSNSDSVTIMVYMCGTDLESKHGMASADIEEMRAASSDFGDNFNLIVYTGGCTKWKNGVSSSVNQIYQIKGGKIKTLVSDDGAKAMTKPETLTSFIKYCTSNFPANRRELILWDHGGGSVSGYGYDEKFSTTGSMTLAGIDKALKNSGTTFDFIGFDACLMATAENALMLNDYADYLIASEETEPGIGWYYTSWLSKFAKNTSMSTLDVGKNIIDDFVYECGRKCSGQKTTLSIIDLAEFSHTVPENLAAFSKSVTAKISQNDYKEVSDARYNTREFAVSSKIDQVDLVNLADNMNTAEGKSLSAALKNAVKYNRTSSNMTNAYGVSIYFPYKRTSYVDKACDTYEDIGMNSEYAECIRKFASLETSGQIAAGGSSSPITSIFGGSSSGSSGSSDIIGQLISGFLGGGRSVIDGLDENNTAFMKDIDTSDASEYLASNYFDASNLVWEQKNGKYVMTLPETQWELVHGLDRNMFYDDGEGWVDLGMDNTFSFDDDGNLVADDERNWVAINGQPVAYYHTDSIKNADGSYTDMGYVPAMLNGSRVNLILVFEGKSGYIAGATADYKNGETETVAKSLTELQIGDKLDFICDFYSYDKVYQDSYYLGEQMTVTEDMKVTNVDVGSGKVRITYCFTDIYNQEYWSPAIEK